MVTGSRDWPDPLIIEDALSGIQESCKVPSAMTLVSGNCPTGADMMAERWAARNGWAVERHPADWKGQGRGAGLKRNAEMAKSGVDICAAFIYNRSRGATHAASEAEKFKVKTLYWRIDE